MGITAENLAEKYQVTRAEQDEFSVQSQNKAEKARADGRFKDEIAAVTVKGRKGDTIVADDEYIRSGVTIDRSEEQTSELQSLMRISYAAFCLQKKRNQQIN